MTLTKAGPDLGFTPQAKETVRNMNDRLNAIRMAFGETSPEHARATASLARSLATMIGLGGNISSDGELSLYGANEFIHYGVNFSRSNRSDEWPYNLVGTWSVNS